MYAGHAVERANVYDIYERPAHPYTKALLESVPRLDRKGRQLSVIKGLPPTLTAIPPGCAFHPRCGYARDVCRRPPVPPLYEVADRHASACHVWQEVRDDD
jgi:oligopeptide transport system ATP-binding protein